MNRQTATSIEVLDYYQRNWEQIAACYDLRPDGLPLDRAFYRRRIYLKILREMEMDNILDIGCGGGLTVLDALQMGRKVQGIEPVAPLVKSAQTLLEENGHDSSLIRKGDMSDLEHWDPDAFDALAALSVLPHVVPESSDSTHQYLANLLRKGGYFVASYRNDLFDLYTFNSFTIDFIVNSLWNTPLCESLQSTEGVKGLEGLIQNPDVPGPFYTDAKDKSFGSLTRVASNPLTIEAYLSRFGLKVLKTYFYNYHCVPPLLKESVQNYRMICHQMDMEMSQDWRGYFMTSTFVILARKTV